MTDSRSRRPLVPGPIGRAASRIYLAELARRNRRYDRGARVERLAIPVISIGNLSVGGTGKTPMVRLACAWLVEAGVRPCIAMRGYKSGTGGSDEAREYRESFPGVALVAQPDRGAGVRALLGTLQGRDIGAVVLDDGFQHRRLARDLDIVLLDATRDPFADRALPAGWLRELPCALRRAHAVVITHTELASESTVKAMAAAALGINPSLLCAAAEHAWEGLRLFFDGGNDGWEPVGWLAGRSVLAVCGIGNPAAFLAGGERAAGRPLAGRVVLRDHAVYTDRVVRRIADEVRRSGADVVLTTGKDMVKLRDHAGALGVPVAAADLRMALTRGGDGLRGLVLGAVGRDRIG